MSSIDIGNAVITVLGIVSSIALLVFGVSYFKLNSKTNKDNKNE